MRFGISVGGFVPKTYVQQVVENSDFRKYDDGLRMILDCTPELERALTQRLAAAAAAGIVRYGLHRQDAAMMTCFTPSALRSDHVHFIDGARGGYASAATALKAMRGVNAATISASSPRSAPGLAAAERADAAFDLQRVRARHRDVAGIAVAVIGVVDLAGPFVRAEGRMPVNSGSPIIGRWASAGLGFLSSTCGLAGGRIDRLPQPDHDAAYAAAAFADAHLGVAGLRQPDTARPRHRPAPWPAMHPIAPSKSQRSKPNLQAMDLREDMELCIAANHNLCNSHIEPDLRNRPACVQVTRAARTGR